MSSSKNGLNERIHEIRATLPEELRKISIDIKIQNLYEAIENVKEYLSGYAHSKNIDKLVSDIHNSTHLVYYIIIDLLIETEYYQGNRLQKIYNVFNTSEKYIEYDMNKISTTYTKIESLYESVFQTDGEFLSSELGKKIKRHCYKYKFQITNNSLGLYYFYMMNKLYILSIDTQSENQFISLVNTNIIVNNGIDFTKIITVINEFLEDYSDKDEYIYFCTTEFINKIIDIHKTGKTSLPEELVNAVFAVENILCCTRNSIYKSQIENLMITKMSESLNKIVKLYNKKDKITDTMKAVKRLSILKTDKRYCVDSKEESQLVLTYLKLLSNCMCDTTTYKELEKIIYKHLNNTQKSANKRIPGFKAMQHRQAKLIEKLDDNITFKEVTKLIHEHTLVSPKRIKECFLDLCNEVDNIINSYSDNDISLYQSCANLYVQVYFLCKYMEPRRDMAELHITKLFTAISRILNSTLDNKAGEIKSMYEIISENFQYGISEWWDNLFDHICEKTESDAATVILMDHLHSHVVNCISENALFNGYEIDIMSLTDSETLNLLCESIRIYIDACYVALKKWMIDSFEPDTQVHKLLNYINNKGLIEEFVHLFTV